MSHLRAAVRRPRVHWKMCRKQAAEQITDLNGSKRRQHLQCNDERTCTTPNTTGKHHCDRKRKQHEGDYAESYSKKQSGRSCKHPNGQHDVPHLGNNLAQKQATAGVLFCGRKAHNLRELANIARCHFSDTSACIGCAFIIVPSDAATAAVRLQTPRIPSDLDARLSNVCRQSDSVEAAARPTNPHAA